MIHNAEFAGTIDVALLTFLVFVGFFFGLVLYLRREDRREGYPLEDDVTGRLEPASGWLFTALPKTFLMPHGQEPVVKPDGKRDRTDLALTRPGRTPGLPADPVGDPMTAGVGPGSYAERARRPDAMHDGSPRLAPLRAAPEYGVNRLDRDPRGRTIHGADGAAAGVVREVWVDRMEFLVRYLEVEVGGVEGGAGRSVLVPMTMVDTGRFGGPMKCKAVLARQFAGAPTLERPDQITLYEEERVCAYFGAGYLYATPARAEPWL